MADFVQKTVNKTAVRDLAVPIATVTSFNSLIEGVIADNPFGCVGYTGADGVAVDPVVRNREHYTVSEKSRPIVRRFNPTPRLHKWGYSYLRKLGLCLTGKHFPLIPEGRP